MNTYRRKPSARCVWSAVVLVAGCVGWDVPVQASGGLACLTKPSMEVSVAAPVEGIIEDVTVDRGDWVSKGQVIVTLEASVEKAAVDLAKAKADAEATIKSAQAKIAFSTRKLERATDLYKSNSIARHELDEAQTEKVVAEMAHQEALENKRMAEFEWQRANALLKLHTIYSPLRGVVVDRLLSPGELARQTPILKLAQIHPLRIEVFAPLSLLGKLEPGMKADVRPDDGTTSAYQAEITVVNRLVDSASGTFGVRLEMPNPENAILAGLPCTITFRLRK